MIDKQVSFRVSPKVKKKLAVAAAQAGMQIKEYVLKKCGLLDLEQKEQGNR